MTACRVLIPAALLSVAVSAPALAQEPAAEAAAPAVVARANRRAPSEEGARRVDTVRAPDVRVRERLEVRPASAPAAPVAAAEDQGGGRRRPSGGSSGGGGGRASGGGSSSGSGGAVRRGGVRAPDSGGGGGSVSGQAVPRSRAPRDSWGGSSNWRPSVARRYYGAPTGFGYYVYDPWSWYGWGWPAYGAYAGWGYGGYYGNYYGGYYSGGYGGYGGYGRGFGWVGGVRLKVDRRDAEVYVDGYYAGTVDDFDGMFQELQLEDGGYRIEIRAPGFETLVFDVRVQPGRTITYRGHMAPAP